MTVLIEAAPEVVSALEAKLRQKDTTLAEKYRVLFSLRNVDGNAAHEALLTALKDSSALFRHEVAFCMGQRQDPSSVQQLTAILRDGSENPMVRHEAGEALGAIGTEECLQPLREHVTDPVREVAETCQLALQRITHFQKQPSCTEADGESRYYSVDPTPALPASTSASDLRAVLLDESQPMFERYRALFALRNKGGAEAVGVLGEVFGASGSALLKHETAYVLGQMQDARATEVLTHVLQDASEHAMVRHEAAEALGSIAQTECLQLLQRYCEDPEPIVADSCIVALDMLEFETSGQFQYASVASCN